MLAEHIRESVEIVMGIAENLLGMTLSGRGNKARQWTVTEKLASAAGHTPGFFSISYKCRDENGVEAFLKASDLTKVLTSDPGNMINLLVEAGRAHQFERDVLEHCRGNRMDRVVTALDFGNDNIVHNGVSDFLFFLVFELAEGDLRKRITKSNSLNLVWSVSAIHEYAVAISQLHGGQIYHNDIKPANALTFNDGGRKIADLGRATTPLMGSVHDRLQCVGDTRFAPPEQIYALPSPIPLFDRFKFQQAGDLWNLGSLAYFLLTGTNVTQEVVGRLRPELRPPNEAGGWKDQVSLITPYWKSLIADMLQEARVTALEVEGQDIAAELDSILSMISELCEPNYLVRGMPSFVGHENQYNLARYIARLDLCRSRLMVRSKFAK